MGEPPPSAEALRAPTTAHHLARQQRGMPDHRQKRWPADRPQQSPRGKSASQLAITRPPSFAALPTHAPRRRRWNTQRIAAAALHQVRHFFQRRAALPKTVRSAAANVTGHVLGTWRAAAMPAVHFRKVCSRGAIDIRPAIVTDHRIGIGLLGSRDAGSVPFSRRPIIPIRC